MGENGPLTPALLIATSIRPNADVVFAMAWATQSSDRMSNSNVKTSIRGISASRSFFVASSSVSLISPNASCVIPWRAKENAVARPRPVVTFCHQLRNFRRQAAIIPVAAPVMNADPWTKVVILEGSERISGGTKGLRIYHPRTGLINSIF